MAQSVHFNKIAKKQNIDFMPIFFSLKGSTVLTKIVKQKVGVSLFVFAVELQKARTKCISLRWEWGEFQNSMYVNWGRKH